MKFLNIWTELFRPCPMLPSMHKKICEVVDAHMKGAAHDESWQERIARLALEKAEENESAGLMVVGDNIAYIPIQGVIGKHVSQIEQSSGVVDVDAIQDQVAEALEDDGVEGIFYDVNSPGGGVTGVPEASDFIAKAAKIKPSLAYTDQLMASAAMWLAAGAGEIVASKSAQVGSIGVYMAFLDASRAYEMSGLKTELIKAGKYKGMGIEGTSLSEEGREMLQAETDMVYDWFTQHVSKYRTVPESAMQGQTFYGSEAKKVGLVDKVGSRIDALKELRGMIRTGVRTGAGR